MKSKHRNFWSFFWRVGTGFLAFYLAVMGVFTYVTAQRKLDEARETYGDYSYVIQGAEYWLDRNMAGGAGGLYDLCNQSLQPLAMVGVFDNDRNLLASSGNYYVLGAWLYLDLERWLTEEEQFRLVELAQESSKPVQTGNVYHTLHYQGWQDNGMFIPYRLTYTSTEYEDRKSVV